MQNLKKILCVLLWVVFHSSWASDVFIITDNQTLIDLYLELTPKDTLALDTNALDSSQTPRPKVAPKHSVDTKKTYTLAAHPIDREYTLLFEEGNLLDTLQPGATKQLKVRKLEPPRSMTESHGLKNWIAEINQDNWWHPGKQKREILFAYTVNNSTKGYTDILYDFEIAYRTGYEFVFAGITYKNRQSFGPVKNELQQRLWEDSDPAKLLDTNYRPTLPWGNNAFGFEIGVPFILFGFEQRPFVTPSHVWIDTDSSPQINERLAGNSLQYFEGMNYANIEDNWGSYLLFKFAYFRWRMDFDSEIYTSTLHQLGFEEMPLFFSNYWGAGWMITPSGYFPYLKTSFASPQFFQNKPLSELLGGRLRTNIAVFFKSSKNFLFQIGISLNFKDPYEYFQP